MSQTSPANQNLPLAGAAALRRLGEDLATARKRRRQSLRDWAARLNVSAPTLMRMEKGDPKVAAGIYATALWLINRLEPLACAADPKEDLAALESEVSEAVLRGKRKAPRQASPAAQAKQAKQAKQAEGGINHG